MIYVVSYKYCMRTTRRSDSILYKRWYQFFNGCTNPRCTAWAVYGARGIKMHPSWASFKQGFDRFEAWVIDTLGPPPLPNSIIRRIDSTKNIRPGNLEWSTRLIMSNNRRTNTMIKINGQRKSLSDWCRQQGLNERTVWSRIHDRGQTPRKALEL